ncbi:MAG: hypothetical protein LBI82_08275 [Dysgonamonadaceae bacterium]|jgi:hypothetical protein|nr:hypothetical protein [Dysgonamonadaceae bacterium]
MDSFVIQFVETKWKYCLVATFCVLSLSVVNGQTIDTKILPGLTGGVQIETQSPLYNAAFLEISDMLDDKQPLSIKRAVFLTEWAYLDGKLDYEEFCKTIDNAADFIEKFIKANGMEKYKTAKNMALIEYFFRPYSGNDHKPFIYDFSDVEGIEDYTKQFVSKVMQTHSGQCRSLPMYYRVLAEAVDAEAYIAYAPRHVFIRYRDEDNFYSEEWVNVELTTHQLVPEFAIKEGFEITEKAIENKLYLHPLTAKETVAVQLADLAFGYWAKYKFCDDFTWLCANKSLEYYPQHPKALATKGNYLESAIIKRLAYNGYGIDEQILFLESQLKMVSEQLEHLGWEDMSEELEAELNKVGEDVKREQEEKF